MTRAQEAEIARLRKAIKGRRLPAQTRSELIARIVDATATRRDALDLFRLIGREFKTRQLLAAEIAHQQGAYDPTTWQIGMMEPTVAAAQLIIATPPDQEAFEVLNLSVLKPSLSRRWPDDGSADHVERELKAPERTAFCDWLVEKLTWILLAGPEGLRRSIPSDEQLKAMDLRHELVRRREGGWPRDELFKPPPRQQQVIEEVVAAIDFPYTLVRTFGIGAPYDRIYADAAGTVFMSGGSDDGSDEDIEISWPIADI